MAQKLTEEKLKSTEREIEELKEMIMGLTKSVKRLAEVLDNNASNKEESGTLAAWCRR